MKIEGFIRPARQHAYNECQRIQDLLNRAKMIAKLLLALASKIRVTVTIMLKRLNFLILFCSLLNIGGTYSYGEDPSSPLSDLPVSSQSLPEIVAENIAPLVVVGTAAEQRFPELVRSKWNSIVDSIKRDDLAAVNTATLELNQLKIIHGLEALEGYSIYLIGIATTRLAEGNRPDAAFFTRKALLLSPSSTRVLIASLNLVKETREGSVVDHLFRALWNLRTQPALIMGFVISIIYPVLWAASFGLYAIFIMHLAFNLKSILKEASSMFPARVRGILAPVLISLGLIAPLFIGPLWCLVVWSTLVLVFVPTQKWLSFYVGVLLVLWGALIPIRETIAYWLEDKSIQTMLSVSAGYYTSLDRAELEKLVAKRSDDGVVYFVYGQLLRRLGEYDLSNQAFLRSELLMGRQPWTKAQRGMVAFDQERFAQADQLFTEAEELGADSAEFYYNFSKVKFELLDTAAGRKLLRSSAKADKIRAEELNKREEDLGFAGRKALAEVSLPIRRLLDSALSPLGDGRAGQDVVADAVLHWLRPTDIILLGGCIIVWFFLSRRTRPRSRYLPYYGEYKTPRLVNLFFRALPGGALVMANRPGWAFLLVSIIVFLLMPIIAWPAENLFLLEVSRQFDSLYLGVLGGIVFMTLLVGNSTEEN